MNFRISFGSNNVYTVQNFVWYPSFPRYVIMILKPLTLNTQLQCYNFCIMKFIFYNQVMYYKTLGGRNTTSVHNQCPLYINQYTDCSMRVKPA